MFKGLIDADELGYIITKNGSTATSLDGVFACSFSSDFVSLNLFFIIDNILDIIVSPIQKARGVHRLGRFIVYYISYWETEGPINGTFLILVG